MTVYPKIETLYERDEQTRKLKEPFVLKNRVYGLLKTWVFDEKINGTNIRVTWAPGDTSIRYDGRQDNSQIPTELLRVLQDTFNHEKFAKQFSDPEIRRVVLYGEGCGAGIQGGGLHSPDKQFVLFDVLVSTYDKSRDRITDWWLARSAVEDVAVGMALHAVPHFGEMTLEEARDMVRQGFKTQFVLEGGNGGPAEGLIGRPLEALFDKKGARVIVKLKTEDFAKPKEEPIAIKDTYFSPAGVE